MDEISRQLIVPKLKYKIMIPPSSLLKPAPTDLYTEIGGEDTTKITNIKNFMDFTIYRGEIQKYNKEIQRFTRISPIYTRIFRKHEII